MYNQEFQIDKNMVHIVVVNQFFLIQSKDRFYKEQNKNGKLKFTS